MGRCGFAAALALCSALAACGGSDGGTTSLMPPPPPIDPALYLAQSRVCDGNPATPLRQGDALACRRFDFGHYQAEDSFLLPDGSAETAWSYPPFAVFDAAAGDGGEHYAVAGGTVSIDMTEDGSQTAIQHFAGWWAFDAAPPSCGQGWESGGTWGRACHAAVTYPATGVPGNAIAADTVVSEHYDLPGLAGKVERAYYARGWGRLAWQVWAPPGSCTPPADLAARSPALSYDGPPAEHPDWVRCDERLVTNIVPADGSLTAAQLWHP